MGCSVQLKQFIKTLLVLFESIRAKKLAFSEVIKQLKVYMTILPRSSSQNLFNLSRFESPSSKQAVPVLITRIQLTWIMC